MKKLLSDYFSFYRALSKKEKFRVAFYLTIMALLAMTLLTICLFSGHATLHNLPLTIAGIQTAMMLVYLLVYKRLFLDVPTIALMLFPIYALVSGFWGFFGSDNLTLFLLAGMAIVVYQFAVTTRSQNRILLVWEISLIAFALVFAIVYFDDIIHFNAQRLGGAFNNINIVAVFFVVGFCLSLYYVLRRKYVAIAPLILFLASGMLTGSKQFVLGIIPAIIVFVFGLFGKKRWYVSMAVLVAIVGIAVLVLQIPAFATIKTRLDNFISFITFTDLQKDGSNMERLAMIEESLVMFSRSPLFGWGHTAFAHLSYFETYSHNALANLLSDYGLIGLTIFAVPIVVVFNQTARRKMNKSDKQIILMLAFMLLVLSICRVFTEDKAYYISIALLLSFVRKDAKPKEYEILSVRRFHKDLVFRRYITDAEGNRGFVLKKDRYKIN